MEGNMKRTIIILLAAAMVVLTACGSEPIKEDRKTYSEGYEEGYGAGYHAGYNEAYDIGFDAGYSEGYGQSCHDMAKVYIDNVRYSEDILLAIDYLNGDREYTKAEIIEIIQAHYDSLETVGSEMWNYY